MEITRANEPLKRDEVRAFLDREAGRRQSNKVQHGHPPPSLWRPLESSAEELLEARAPSDNVNVYQGMPFCVPTNPGSCGFCLFPHEDYARGEELDRYLGYLRRETRLLTPYYKHDTVRSVYFGGGTPSLYRPHHYPKIMEMLHELYGGIPDDVEVTLEGLPGLFNEAKISAMAGAGINRVSMGVQQFSDRLIAFSGRHQTRGHVLRALELCRKYDMAHSIDLIFGWPTQTEQDMLEDLQTVVDEGVPHLTHYELNVAGRSAFARLKADLPSLAQTRRMYHVAKRFLQEAGYVQRTVYDWQKVEGDGVGDRRGEYRYEGLMHEFDAPELEDDATTRQVCGHGFNAISFHLQGIGSELPSWIWANHRNTTDYYASLDRGELPVAMGFPYNPDDVRLNWLYQRMQTLVIDTDRYAALFGHAFDDLYGAVVDELVERGWAVRDAAGLRFVGDGECHVPMFQALLSSKRVAEIRNSGTSRLRDVPVVVEPA